MQTFSCSVCFFLLTLPEERLHLHDTIKVTWSATSLLFCILSQYLCSLRQMVSISIQWKSTWKSTQELQEKCDCILL